MLALNCIPSEQELGLILCFWYHHKLWWFKSSKKCTPKMGLDMQEFYWRKCLWEKRGEAARVGKRERFRLKYRSDAWKSIEGRKGWVRRDWDWSLILRKFMPGLWEVPEPDFHPALGTKVMFWPPLCSVKSWEQPWGSITWCKWFNGFKGAADRACQSTSLLATGSLEGNLIMDFLHE